MRPRNGDEALREDRSCEWMQGGASHLFFTEILFSLIIDSNLLSHQEQLPFARHVKAIRENSKDIVGVQRRFEYANMVH